MASKPKKAKPIDLDVNNLPGNSQTDNVEEEKKVNPPARNGYDLWNDIAAALSEKEILELREQLHKIAAVSDAGSASADPYFNLAEKTDIVDFLERWLEDPADMAHPPEPLPKIHVHQHRRAAGETIHQLYRQQSTVGPETAEMQEQENDDDWILLGEALQEKDIMELRENLRQLMISQSSHSYSVEDIDEYVSGMLTTDESERFEEELMNNPELRADAALNRNLEKAVSETDVIALREAIHKIMQKQNSTNRSLVEIDSYLEDGLADSDKSAFLEELMENDGLKAEVRLVNEVNAAMGEREIMKLREALKQISEEILIRENRFFLPWVNRHKVLKVLGAVAAILFVVLGFTSILHFSGETGKDVYDSFFDAPPAVATYRFYLPEAEINLNPGERMPRRLGQGVNDQDTVKVLDGTGFLTGSAVGNFNQGFSYYIQGDYKKAIPCYNRILESDEDNPVANYYSGASYQCLGQYRKAIPFYSRVIRNNDNNFVEQAEWYRSLCHVGLGENRIAANQLTAIIGRKGYFEKDALLLLKKLKKVD